MNINYHPASTRSPLVALLATAIRLDMASPNPITRQAPPPLPPVISAEAATAQGMVLAMLKQLGAASPKEIGLHIQASRSTITRALRDLEDSGQIRATGETNSRRYTVAVSEVAS